MRSVEEGGPLLPFQYHHLAAFACADLAVCELCKEKGFDASEGLEGGLSLLHLACLSPTATQENEAKHLLSTVRVLVLQLGLAVDAVDDKGRTPLDLAAARGFARTHAWLEVRSGTSQVRDRSSK